MGNTPTQRAEAGRRRAQAAVERATELEKIALRTLSGDVRDFLLHRLRDAQDQRPWSDRSEADQRATISAATTAAEQLVRQVVALVANHGLPAIGGVLEGVTAKNGLKATISLSGRNEVEVMSMLKAAAGYGSKAVTVVLADADSYLEERAPVAINKDQPPLPDPTFAEPEPEPEEATDGGKEKPVRH